MGTTAQKLQTILDSKEAIRQSINNKGVQVTTGDTLSTYASKIDAISTGSVVVKDYLVRFFDYDGTILKEEWVYSGDSATPPSTPSHQYLTFNEWNNPYTGVTSDVDTGAVYSTSDGKSYLFITLSPITSGLTPTLYFNKSSTSLMTVDWGDGQTSTSTTSGNQNLSHTYSGYGSYTITVDNSAGGTYAFSNASSTLRIFGNGIYRYCLIKIYLGANMTTIPQYCYHQCYSLYGLMIPKSVTTISNVNGVFFQECSSMDGIVIPSSITTGLGSAFQISYGLKYVILPSTLTVFGDYIFNGCTTRLFTNIYKNQTSIGVSAFASNYGCHKFVIPETVTTIGNTAFQNNLQVASYLCYPTTPPTLGTTVFNNINQLSKIYVADAVVNTYKAASGWNAYADIIYPISTYTP